MSNLIRTNEDVALAGCVMLSAQVTLFITNVLLGCWSIVYLAVTLAHTQISWIGAILIGLFVGQFSVPIAIVVMLWQYFT